MIRWVENMIGTKTFWGNIHEIMKSTKIRQFTQTNQEFTKTSLNMDAIINYGVEFSQQNEEGSTNVCCTRSNHEETP